MFVAGKPTEEFFNHLRVLAQIPPSAFEEFCRVWPMPPLDMTRESRDALIALAKTRDLSLDELASAISFATAVLSEVQENEDDLTAVLADSFEQAELDDDERDVVQKNLEIYENTIRESITKEMHARRAFQATFPYLEHIHTRTSSYIQFKNEYNVADDRPSSYEPGAVTMEHVTIVQLDINAFGDTSCLSFALREHELDKLVRRLELARCQLTAAKSGESSGKT